MMSTLGKHDGLATTIIIMSALSQRDGIESATDGAQLPYSEPDT